ncbi:MAG: hypothetical protein R2879_15835 [Saprospiraceae bacterium]
MPVWLSVILEIIKITVPALIVFLTVYYLMKGFFENQRALKHLEIRQASQKQTIPLKLQAYERLALFCERIAIPNLLLRMREEGMTAKDLRISMLLAIQQEFEYNLTQQVYVSEQLWEIIKLARDETVNIVNEVCNELPKEADGRQLAGTLLNLLDGKSTGLDKAQMAIKKEASLML